MSTYAPGTLVEIGTDPAVGGQLFTRVDNGQAGDPATVTFEWSWWTFAGSTEQQVGATNVDVYGQLGSAVTRTQPGGYTRLIDTTGMDGLICKYRVSGSGGIQAAKEGSFLVGVSTFVS